MTHEKRELTNAQLDDIIIANPATRWFEHHELLRGLARSAIGAHEALNADAGMRQVPEGWKLVPIEPTANMIRAMAKAWQDAQKLKGSPFEAYVAQLLHAAWIDGWASCRDAEFVGDEAMHEAFNQCVTLNVCLSIEQAPPAEQQGEQEPVARVLHRKIPAGHGTPEGHTFDIKWLKLDPFKWQGDLYSRPDNRLAELRAKVEGLAGTVGTDLLYRRDVLAEIDKAMGEQR